MKRTISAVIIVLACMLLFIAAKNTAITDDENINTEEKTENNSENDTEKNTEARGNGSDDAGDEIDPADVKWILKNYEDESGRQGMFYTLYNSYSGRLIVVDGGWYDNTNQVRQAIEEYGGHVDAWIITHYDDDHVDAFNAINEYPGDITIGDIYANPVDYDYWDEHQLINDSLEAYLTFITDTAGDSRVHYVTRDEEIYLYGLKIHILNCYDEVAVSHDDGHISNNSSIVFKVSGNEKSMLFCADCQRSMADYLIEEYGDELKSNYVQCGHHGNMSLPTYFYEAVDPQVAFFDAPEWLATGSRYTTKNLMHYLKNTGVKCLDWSTAPNPIYLW